MQKAFPPTNQMIKPLLCHFRELLEIYRTHQGQKSSTMLVTQLKSNFTNTQNIFRHDLYSELSEFRNTVSDICMLNGFSCMIGYGKISLLEELSCFAPKFDHYSYVRFSMAKLESWILVSISKPISNPKALIAQGIEHLHHCDDPVLKGKAWPNLC